MATIESIVCRPRWRSIRSDVQLAALSQAMAGLNNPAILGGNASVRGHSIFTAEPVEVFEFALGDCDPFEKLEVFLSKYVLAGDSHCEMTSGAFCGGWIGTFGYELGRFIETLPGRAVDDLSFPVIRLAFYDKAIVYDHAAGQLQLLAVEWNGSPAQEKFDTLADWLRQAQDARVSVPPRGDVPAADSLTANITRPRYFEALEKTKRHIIDGDVYQINFSRRFESDFFQAPIALFHAQNVHNPSPYAAFLAWADKAVVSASPELFLHAAGGQIVTRPIKGTRPRNPQVSDKSPENVAHCNDLIRSEKDQAELAMIVDLERNDLAKICIPGTRHVSCARAIEAFPTVYHAVGVVEGTLAAKPSPRRIIEILKAAFPGGSITGAPKIRAMEIIDELEPTARSIYTGSIGWIGLNFDLCWNIAIRTILVAGQKAYVQTGGGIVADSDPGAEWDETLTKAAALLASIQAVGGG